MREPLFHIVRRNSSSRLRGWAVRGIAILAAVLLSGLLTFLVTGRAVPGMETAIITSALLMLTGTDATRFVLARW